MTTNVRSFAALNTLVDPSGNAIRSNGVAEPARMTQPGSAQAAQGVSMADMIAQAVAQAMAAQGGSPAVQSAPKARKAQAVQTVPVARVQAAQSRQTRQAVAVQTADEKTSFDPRTYYQLGADLVGTSDGSAYIAQSVATNLLVCIGVQRKAIALSVDKARLLRDLLNGLNLPE